MRRPSAAGFTLIELLVALGLSLVLVVAMLKMQSSLAQQTMRNADAGVRDNEWRVAVDAITTSVNSAGFLLGGTQKPCNEMFTYNSGASSTSKFFTHHSVDSVAASASLNLPFALGLTLNYPASGSSTPSDVLAVTTSNDASGFSDSAAPVVPVFSNSAYTPSSTGLLPVQTTSKMTAGDVGVLQVALSNRIACFRTPLTSFSTAAGSPNVQAGDPTLAPANFYSDYAPALASAGYPVMTNAVIFQGQLVDMSPSLMSATTPSVVTSVYYIDGTTYRFPVLMRANYSFANDQLVTGSAQVVAAGVISLQVLYGVDPLLTGSTTAYENAATLTTNNHWDVVRTVKVLLVSRSLADDNSIAADGTTYTAPPLTIPAGFAAVPIPTTPIDFSKRHYAVNQFEIAERNTLWNCSFGSICVP